MTMESGRLSNRMASSRSSGRSRKSLSSDGSLNKRKIKSNSALLSKQFQIMKVQGKFTTIAKFLHFKDDLIRMMGQIYVWM